MSCGRCRGSGWLLHTDAVGGERCRSSGAEPVPCSCAAAESVARAPSRRDAAPAQLPDRGGDAVRRRPYKPFGFGDR